MEEILIDSDVIIDYLRGYNARIKSLFVQINNRKLKVFISVISIVELYAGKMGNGKHEEILKALLSYLEILYLNTSLAQSSGLLKGKYSLSLGDSIVAATAIEHSISLCTFNKKHFEKIRALQLYDFETD